MDDEKRVPAIDLETVLDWAYCEAKVWWKTVGRTIEEKAEQLISPRTGSQLLKESIQGALKLGLKSHQKGNKFDFHTVLGSVWKARLKKWGMGHLREKLAAYAVLYEELMSRFDEKGDIRKKDGSLYENPTWSHRWRSLAISLGLTELRLEIDAEQHRAGLGIQQDVSKMDLWTEPIGIADAFARSVWISRKNDFNFEDIVGVGEKVFISLPHIKISVTPDLIIQSGKELIYEAHLYQMRNPSVPGLLSDYRIKALFSAYHGEKEEAAGSVMVRHLMTGRSVRLNPRRAAGLSEIAPMAAAIKRRINAKDFSGPRMVNGWDACGDCEYKPLCFDGGGLMQRYNLPLSGRIAAADEFLESTRQELTQYTEEEAQIGIQYARVILPWVAQNPGMTEEQIEWLLKGLS